MCVLVRDVSSIKVSLCLRICCGLSGRLGPASYFKKRLHFLPSLFTGLTFQGRKQEIISGKTPTNGLWVAPVLPNVGGCGVGGRGKRGSFLGGRKGQGRGKGHLGRCVGSLSRGVGSCSISGGDRSARPEVLPGRHLLLLVGAP